MRGGSGRLDGFANLVTHEATNADVVSELLGDGADVSLKLEFRVLDEPLLEQAGGLEELVEFALDNLGDSLRGLFFTTSLCAAISRSFSTTAGLMSSREMAVGLAAAIWRVMSRTSCLNSSEAEVAGLVAPTSTRTPILPPVWM